jgi:hypothetical protein
VPRGFNELKTLVNKVAVGMDNTFTVIVSQLGCINWMLTQCCNKIGYKLRSKLGSVLNAMDNRVNVIWNAEWNGCSNGKFQL